MTLGWRYAAASDVGLLREGNEDAAFAGSRLLAVADGMGGHAAGEVASAAVIAALEQLDEEGVNAGDPREALREAVEEANRNLRDMVAAEPDLTGMGTTITAVLTDGDFTWLAHIGDSRAYLMRDGTLRQLTRDHTFVQQLVDEGRIAPDEVRTHPQRSLITRALDGREQVELDLERVDLQPGDRLLLCSDGLSGVVSDASLAEVLHGGTPDETVRSLVDLALRGGGPDNITCIVADAVEDGDAKDDPAPVREIERRRDADDRDPRVKAKALRRRNAAIAGAVVVVLLAVASVLGYRWTQRQFYVGESAGRVAIYRGVEGSLAWIDLSNVEETVPLALDDLSDFERKRVTDGIHAESMGEARQIVARLQQSVTR